jgi:hypothetical protein
MEYFGMSEIINIATAVVASLSISGGIILGLSAWLGKVWASRILEQDRLKYAKEFEQTKSKYEKQLEKYKQELEKSKITYLRYSEYQFRIYNELWNKLCKLRDLADELWGDPNLENARAFIFHLKKTVNSVENNRLLIEESHFAELRLILNKFERFNLAKVLSDQLKSLPIKIKASGNDDLDEKFRAAVRSQQHNKNDYDELLEKMALSFKNQISIN